VNSITDYSPIEIIYGFNLLAYLGLIPLLIDGRVNLDGN
jgi:hypothetical protein